MGWSAEDYKAFQERQAKRNIFEPVVAKNATARRGARPKFRVSEEDEQKALIERCRLYQGRYPELSRLYAVPNGGYRHKATAAKMKAEGQRAGVLDLALDVPRGGYHGFKLELKAQGGTVSEAQYRELVAGAAEGYKCVVAWGAEEAWREIEAYLKAGAK